MHALTVTPSRARRGLATPLVAAALLLAGCAQERHYGIGGPPSACGVNAVLYCEMDPRNGREAERCHCVSSGRMRDMLGVLSRP